MELCGGVELGGTKIVCAIGSSGKIHEKINFPTRSPSESVAEIVKFFKKEKISAIGIGSFGPINIDPKDRDFGLIANCVKDYYWSNFNIVKALERHFDLPVFLDTDVNVAAFGEYLFGAGKNLSSIVYWTVGTGIGAGIILLNEIYHGLVNTEMGHWLVSKDSGDSFEGVCPVHKDCLEGLASGTALMKRWQVKIATDLRKDHKGWDLEAKYLSIAMINTILAFSPERIIIGGGVMKNQELLSKIRKLVFDYCHKFYQNRKLEDMEKYIVAPSLKDESGIIGAIALAEKGLSGKKISI